MMPGHSTIWQLRWMPPSASRYRWRRESPANRLCIMVQRSWGSMVCTDTLMGLMCIWRMRSTSRSSMLVSVM